ncbi:hypothetical protein P168DRAFT_303441 [Aspergillus campestris IBT 28561]|uniref:Integral membrane protein n=1 Tax=Aspergillus campestris (strain IBT 28561) TaxID=1392248 RepID=A0A2I1D743_ASPC2|nr:uncharacterized protein P168DRAFT_303441 [Aspergillus campestris IBT 28561]PKY05695.1 hypothetical protein P168DRAFT_303441 [Aspergillus campestris IBT 28561]
MPPPQGTQSHDKLIQHSIPIEIPEHGAPNARDNTFTVLFARHHRSRSLYLSSPRWYRNSLLASAGYLEFANAGDFAANVWNEVPVPRHAIILMAIGGPLALLMSLVAARDALLSWRNVRLLRGERRELLALKDELLLRRPTASGDASDAALIPLIEGRLRVGIRELGTEIVDRIAMDVLLGIGALLVGIGTLMAIVGIHPPVYRASNLLSGFVGNSFAAAFGVVNAVWSWYLVCRFRRHDRACMSQDQAEGGEEAGTAVAAFKGKLHCRFFRLQVHAVVSGVTGLVAGAASMVTARMWWGYVLLIPCMGLQVACNRFWRRHLGYDRPVVSTQPKADTSAPPFRNGSPPQEPEKTSLPAQQYTASITSSSDSILPAPFPAPLTRPISFNNPNNNTNKEEKQERICIEHILLTSLAETNTARAALDPLPSTLGALDRSSLEGVMCFMETHALFDSLCDWLVHDGRVPGGLHRAIFSSVRDGDILVPSDLAARVPPAEHDQLKELCLKFLGDGGRHVLICRERYLLELVGCTLADIPITT